MFKKIILTVCFSPLVCYGASFNCQKAASSSEIIICSDPELSKLDDELAKIYQNAKINAKNAALFKKQASAAWKWREENCSDASCLKKWYGQRKSELLKVSASLPKKCTSDGSITMTGFVVPHKFNLEPDNRESIAYILNVKKPVCVHIEPMDIGQPVDEMVTRFQLVSYDNQGLYKQFEQKAFTEVKVTGLLSTNNISQYYIEQNAIDVKGIIGVNTP